MTTTQKANLIEESTDFAYFKLITTKDLNDIFSEKKESFMPNSVYTTKDNRIATKNALEQMLTEGLI